MNISEIQVDQFGVWRNLNLPLEPQGLTVLHGPNEAGKTTLLRFLRGMLYGWHTAEGPAGTAGPNLRSAGALQLQSGLSTSRLQRDASGSRSDLTLTGRADPRSAQAGLDESLKGISEQVYQNVFAIGLRELQELGTLDDRQVSELIYGLTLGVEGQRLLGAWTGVREDRRRYLDPVTGSGLLAELQGEHDRLEIALQQHHGDMAERHEKLATRRDRVETEMASCRQRQQGIQSQLRGHQFLDRVHGPWTRARECEAELDRMPDIGYFPSDGVERLRKLETERIALEQTRAKLRSELGQLRETGTRLGGNSEIQKFVGALHGFILQRNWLRDLEQRIAEANDRVELSRLEFELRLEKLGGKWSVNEIDQADVGAISAHRLRDSVRTYRTALEKHSAAKRGCQRLKQACQKQSQALDAELSNLDGMTLDEALGRYQRQFEDLKSLANLRVHEAALEERCEGLEIQIAYLRPRQGLPVWVYMVLGVFCLAGASLGYWGILKGITSSEIAGMTYLLLGLTTAGVAWGVKSQFEGDSQKLLKDLEADAAAAEADLIATQQAIEKLMSLCDFSNLEVDEVRDVNAAQKKLRTARFEESSSQSDAEEVPTTPAATKLRMSAPSWSDVRERARDLGSKMWQATREKVLGFDTQSKSIAPVPAAPETRVSAVDKKPALAPTPVRHKAVAEDVEPARHDSEPAWELAAMQHVAGRVAQLDELRRSQRSLHSRRARLEERRRELADVQKEFYSAHTAWRDLLGSLNLPLDLAPQQVARHCESLADAKAQRTRVLDVEEERSQLQSLWNSFQQRIEELGRRLHWDADYRNPLHVLDRWEAQLTTWSKAQQDRKEVLRQYRSRRQERSRLARQLKTLAVRRNALLVQGGAGDVEEFEERAQLVVRRRDLEQQLDDAHATLAQICSAHRDLAIVEDDLKVFNPQHNTAFMETLRRELHDLERDLAVAAEQLGGVRREIELLEADREPTRLRFDQAQLSARLAAATQEWLALDAACMAIDEMRTKFERSCQPRTLAMASRLFLRMTRGRFANIWTPLDRRELRIEDERQVSYTVEQLSCGTREQLFLSVRLALVEDLARQGIALPMVLDDVFVNFDEQRAEAAADVLLEFAAQGRQVLFFTCHKHLADLFAARGARLVELPARDTASELETLRLRAG